MINIEYIEKRIGYSFKNKELLIRAFTHKSFNSNSMFNYESLEFLGDAIIEYVVSELLLKEFPSANEGKLTKIRAALVMRSSLAESTDELKIVDYMQLGEEEKKRNIEHDSKRKCDLYESIVAAIYLDSQSIIKVKKFLLPHIKKQLNNITSIHDSNIANYKSEINKKYPGPTHKVKYVLLDEKINNDQSHEFTVALFIDNKLYAKGKGNTIKIAEGNAAKIAMKK